MPQYSYSRMAKTVDTMIRQHGMHENSKKGKFYLVRDGQRRICRACEIRFNTRDIDGEKILQTDRRFVLSSKVFSGTLYPAPDSEKDTALVVSPLDESTELIFARPPMRLAPSGVVVFWELHLRSP